MLRTRLTPAALALLPLAFLGLMAVGPVLRLFAEGAGQPSANLWADDYLRWRLLWSVLQAAASCLAALLAGLPVAWVLARFDFPGRALVLRLLMLPFVMPPLVAGIGVLALVGPHGLTGVDLQDTPWLLLYGNLFYNLPLVVRAALDGFAQVPQSRLAAARTLGAGPWRAFWRVELPTARPWILPALCLVFLYCFSGFGIALLLGGQRYATVEVEIYSLVAYELNLADAALLAYATMTISALTALAYALAERRLAQPLRFEPVARTRAASLWSRLAVAAALGLLFFCGGAPLLAVLGRALLAGRAGWVVLLEPDTVAALWNTTRFTLMALGAVAVLGVAHALAARRSLLMRALGFLPFVVSSVCVAFGLLLLYPAYTASLGLLVASYAFLAYPFVTKNLLSAFDAVPAHLAEAARTLGASPARTFWRVSWPLAREGFVRGMAFAAATAVGEFAVTLFLSRPEWTTLTTLIYQHLGRPGSANLDAAMVLAAGLMVLALAAFLVIDRPARATRGGEHA